MELKDGYYKNTSGGDPYHYVVFGGGKYVQVWKGAEPGEAKPVTIQVDNPGKNSGPLESIAKQISDGTLTRLGAPEHDPDTQRISYHERLADRHRQGEDVDGDGGVEVNQVAKSDQTMADQIADTAGRAKDYAMSSYNSFADKIRTKMAEMKGLGEKKDGPTTMSGFVGESSELKEAGVTPEDIKRAVLGDTKSEPEPKPEPEPSSPAPKKKFLVDSDGNGKPDLEVLALPDTRRR